MNPPPIELRQVTSPPLRGLSLPFGAGCCHMLTGDGTQSTCLRVASLLAAPVSGEVLVEGAPTAALDDAARTALRARRFGFVFSAPFLLPGMSVIENVAMPLFKVLGVEPAEARDRTEAALAFVGLRPSEAAVATLDAFDQQRVALARALAHGPAALVLDRIEAGLGPEERMQLVALARRAGERYGVAVLICCDELPPLAAHDRVLCLAEGALREERLIQPMESVPFS